MTTTELLSEAKKAIRERNREKAWRLLQEYVSKSPDDVEAWLMIGGLAGSDRRFEYLQIARRIAPQDNRVKQAIAWAEKTESKALSQDVVPVIEQTRPHAVLPKKKKKRKHKGNLEVIQPKNKTQEAINRKESLLKNDVVKMPKVDPKILKWIKYVGIGLFILVISILFFIGISALITGTEPEILGRRIIIVTSGSMEPTFYTGSIIIVDTREGQAHETGDVITFWTAEEPNLNITHRIIHMEQQDGEWVYQTKGDNNNAPDLIQIKDENIVGKYIGFTVPLMGYFFSFIKSRNGIILFAFLFGLYLIITQVFKIKNLMATTDIK